MPSMTPGENALSKSVDTFGLGTYDSPQVEFDHGEDDEDRPKSALPQDGGPEDPFGPDRLLSYPLTVSSDVCYGCGGPTASCGCEACSCDDAKVGESALPSDADNPSSRADYYDRMSIGNDIWPDEDTGAYAGSQLPGVVKNEVSMDDFLGALGNAWSGSVLEDVSGPSGFPTPGDQGRTSRTVNGTHMRSERTATDLKLVGDIASAFIKEYGKKDLTRRHVMAFLQDNGHHQYMASDVIRCLRHRHEVYVADVLDEFPIRKVASEGFSGLAGAHRALIDLEIQNVRNPDVSRVLRKCAADLAGVMSGLERFRSSDV